jgi:Protein of unknown function (DUF3105)
MARKDRAPTPPKRSQGPQRRATVASAADAERRRRTIILFAGSALALAAAVLAIVFLTGSGGGEDERGALEDADCTLQSFPAQDNAPDHSDVPSLDTKPKWNSSPPTSGPHFGQTAVWGSYDEEVPLVQSTHNLEHGGVVIHYGPDVPEDEVAALKDWYANLDEPNGLIISPLSTNAAKITLSAWTAPEALSGSSEGERGWLATCAAFDESAFEAFIEEHRYKGPERLDPEQLAPGT